MRTKNSPENPLPDERIGALINTYFDRRRDGEPLTPDAFAAEHPDLADELRPYLEGVAILDQIGDLDEIRGLDHQGSELPSLAAYDIVEEIGHGGMGIVYKAIQSGTKRPVALKVMLGGPFVTEAARKRFEREIELAAKLEHPGIVRILESSEDLSVLYYAMDFVEGRTLNRFLADANPSLHEVLDIMARVCEAVEYAHQRGVIHRDLKPTNILIDDATRRPHLTDFGLATIAEEGEQPPSRSGHISVTGQVLGTLPYLSPEQASGSDLDRRTDVYALGVVLYQALTGKYPYDVAGRPSDVIQRINEAQPISPSAVATSVDDEVATIILTALQKDRDRRYQTAAELGEDIRRYLADEPIHATLPSSFYYLRKKLKKHRFAAVGAAVLGLIIMVVLLSAQRSHSRERWNAQLGAVRIQNVLEGDQIAHVVGPARLGFQQFPELSETGLVWAQALHRTGQQVKAIRFLEAELRDDRSAWHCRALLADIWDASQDATRASTLRAQAEREAPDTGAAWYLRSFATLHVERALQCAEESVRRSSNDVPAWRRVTDLRLRTGKLEKALEGADRLIALEGRESMWALFKAQIYVRQGMYAKAIEQYTARIKLRPRSSTLYRYRATALRRVDRYAAAVADISKALQLDGRAKRNVWDFFQRATPLWILGRTEEALDDCRRVRSMLGRPTFADARRVLMLRHAGRMLEAENVLLAATGETEDVWLHSLFRFLAGELETAQLIEAAHGDREHQCEAFYYIGEMHLLAGEIDAARQRFEECVQTGVAYDLDTFAPTPMNEHELARWRLGQLDPSPGNAETQKKRD